MIQEIGCSQIRKTVHQIRCSSSSDESSGAPKVTVMFKLPKQTVIIPHERRGSFHTKCAHIIADDAPRQQK